MVHSDIPRHGPTPCPPKVQQRSPQVVLLVFTVCQDGQHCTYSPHRRCSERFDLLKHVVEDHADDQVCEQHWQTSSAPANADQKMAHPGGSGARRFERDFDTASVRESASMQVVSVRVRVCVCESAKVGVRRFRFQSVNMTARECKCENTGGGPCQCVFEKHKRNILPHLPDLAFDNMQPLGQSDTAIPKTNEMEDKD